MKPSYPFHPLPAAPHFVGREAELERLRAWWRPGGRGVLALVGLGGSGKTALATAFLNGLLESSGPPAGGLFVWSFYLEPDAGLFLREACRHLGGDGGPAKGAGLLHLLRDALARRGPSLLVLDGLERVQRPGGPSGEGLGQLDDPLLKGLLGRLAEENGPASVLVTSRFPLTDLEPQRGRGYEHLDMGGLAPDAARALLRFHGVFGDDATLAGLIEAYGAHPLTLDHLGHVVGQFLGGDAARAPELPVPVDAGGDRQAVRLARLFRAYEEHLPPPELALLGQLCVLRRSITEGQLSDLFLCQPPVLARTARGLSDALVRLAPGAADPEGDMRDLADAAQGYVEAALAEAPLAGPEPAFQKSVGEVYQAVCQETLDDAENDFTELAHLYAGAHSDRATDERPLGRGDREVLAAVYARLVKLRTDPYSPFKDPAFGIKDVLKKVGFQSEAGPLAHLGPVVDPGTPEDVGPTGVIHAFRRVRSLLHRLLRKHRLLRGVREVCNYHRRKAALAGPLAELDAAGLGRVLESLVRRHLVLREAGGSYSIHPAVRDHFHRLALSGDGGRHDLLCHQMISLVRRPGQRLPEDPAGLDLVEEAIYHALQAGRRDEAWALYERGLGGLRHLGWRLGEMARGLRILRGFEPCPDRWALAWYLRALGEFDEAYAHNGVPYFRADVRLLQGRLPEVAAEGEDARAAVAAFLMGRTRDLPPDLIGGAVPLSQLLLYLGRFHRVRGAADKEALYKHMGWEGDRARCQLVLAEAARRQNDPAGGRRLADQAAAWVLHAGSVEHLCQLHLVQARLGRAAGDGEASQRAVSAGLHLARAYGLGLFAVELACEQAEICLARADAPAAAHFASAALERASAQDCLFLWGAAEAAHLLGRALAEQGRFGEARPALERAAELRRGLGDPREAETARLLDRVRR